MQSFAPFVLHTPLIKKTRGRMRHVAAEPCCTRRESREALQEPRPRYDRLKLFRTAVGFADDAGVHQQMPHMLALWAAIGITRCWRGTEIVEVHGASRRRHGLLLNYPPHFVATFAAVSCSSASWRLLPSPRRLTSSAPTSRPSMPPSLPHSTLTTMKNNHSAAGR